MVVGEGFEPSKALPLDLQSNLVGHLSTPPQEWSLGNPNEPRIVPEPSAPRKRKSNVMPY